LEAVVEVHVAVTVWVAALDVEDWDVVSDDELATVLVKGRVEVVVPGELVVVEVGMKVLKDGTDDEFDVVASRDEGAEVSK
jgi:hypothetical protein